MIYFRRNGDTLERYEVVFDEQKLDRLIVKIAKNCGEKYKCVRKNLEQYQIPRRWDSYKNYDENGNLKSTTFYREDLQYEKNGKTVRKLYDWDEYQEPLYDCTFTSYLVPNIVDFMMKLYSNNDFGDEEVLTIIFNRDFSFIEHFPTVEEKIIECNAMISKYQDELINKRKKIDELSTKSRGINSYSAKLAKSKCELDRYMSIREQNKGQEPVEPYIEEFLSLIEFRLVSTIELSEIERVNSFFIVDEYTNASEVMKMVLKK